MSLQTELSRLDNEIKDHQALLDDPELAALVKEEINRLKEQKKFLEKTINTQQSVEKKPAGDDQSSLDNRPATIEVRPGTGGDEAKIWAFELARMYRRFCESLGLKVALLDNNVFKVTGKAYSPN